jgi:hypothetical protein
VTNYRGIDFENQGSLFPKKVFWRDWAPFKAPMLRSLVSLFNKYPVVAPIVSAGKGRRMVDWELTCF